MADHPFSAAAWRRNAERYAAIRDMPFNLELAAGSLRIECFRHYILQDAKYLVGFGQALALAAAKADDPALVEQFSRAATEAIVVERALHADYFRQFGIGEVDVAGLEATPACHHYVSFLIASGYREPLPVHAAALLPCFWIYREVGRHVLGRAAPENPYRAWIDTYSGEEFAAAVDSMIAATDELATKASAGTLSAMHDAFAHAVRLEWMFWDSAYREATWPL